MGQRHSWPELRQVNGDLLGVHCIRVRLKGLPEAADPALEIGDGLVIHREDAVLGPGLDGHVADGEAVVHLQAAYSVPAELQGLVERAVHPNHPDEVENQVLAADIGSQLTRQVDFDSLGHLEPGGPGGHAGCHVSGTHAGGERAQSAVSTGVGVRADDDLARGGQALFGN